MNKTEEELLDIVAKFLKEQEWKVAVIGGIKVIKRGSSKYNFTLSIDFTGKRKDKK